MGIEVAIAEYDYERESLGREDVHFPRLRWCRLGKQRTDGNTPESVDSLTEACGVQ